MSVVQDQGAAHSWPVEGLPAFTVRRSTRASRARINVTPHDGVVVVVPDAWEEFDAAAAVRDRLDWITAAQAEFAPRRAALLADAADVLPVAVQFAATGESWPVVRIPTSASSVRAATTAGRIELRGAVDDAEGGLAALRRWLHARAVERLVPALSQLAEQTGARPVGVGVRGQRARWGGCSERGYITLNRALLFLPPDLVRAVMLHELAHLAHPNHSRAFWDHLAAIDPDVTSHRLRIASSWDHVPPWADRR